MRLRSVFRFGAIGWILWRLFGPEVPPRHRGVQTRPPEMPGRAVRVGRTDMFVRESGPSDAPPLVLLHGWVYDAEATWHKVVPLLADRHHVYLIDLRGHGKTDRSRGRFDITDVADDVASLFTKLGLGGVPVVGYSMGGMVAQALARRHPTLVSKLVLAATAAQPIPWPRWLTVPGLVLGRAMARFDRITLPRVMHRYLTSSGAVAPEHSAWLWEELLDRDVELYYESGFAILRFDGSEWARHLTLPVLNVIPTEDQLIPPRLQYATASALSDARIEEVVGAGHEAVLTHPDMIAKAIGSFLE